jgi:PKD repeat protein
VKISWGRASALLVFGLALAMSPAPAVGAAAADTPIASFTSSPPAPVVGQTVTFDGSASNDPDGDTITSYSWAFGDGDTQTTASATTTHAYGTRGSFTVRLTVLDSKGNASAPVTHTVLVGTVDTAPTARFKRSPRKPLVGEAVTVNGSASGDPDGDTITSYSWTFGDGSSQTTTSASTTHSYAAVGLYTITLTVQDSRGSSSAPVSHTVTVKAPQTYPVPSVPTASFTFLPARPVTGQFVMFDASSSNGAGHPIKHYLWEFGDGSIETTTGAVAYHVYRRAGTVTVRLMVEIHRHIVSAPATQRLTIVGRPHISRLHLRVCLSTSRRCVKRGLQVRFRLSQSDQVVLTVRRRGHRHRLVRVVVFGRRGRNSVRIRFAGRSRFRYVLKARARGGNSVSVRFAWGGP